MKGKTESDKTVAPPSPPPAPSADAPITLEEWATGQSRVDRQVEMLNAFVAEERVNKHRRDTSTNFVARYKAFAARPCK